MVVVIPVTWLRNGWIVFFLIFPIFCCINLLPVLLDGVSGSGRFPGLIILFNEPIRSRSDKAGLGGGIGRGGGID